MIRLYPENNGGNFSAGFSIGPLSTEPYFAAVVWVHSPYNDFDQRPVLGTFGCDTLAGCTGYRNASDPLCFYAYGDASRHLFYNKP